MWEFASPMAGQTCKGLFTCERSKVGSSHEGEILERIEDGNRLKPIQCDTSGSSLVSKDFQ